MPLWDGNALSYNTFFLFEKRTKEPLAKHRLRRFGNGRPIYPARGLFILYYAATFIPSFRAANTLVGMIQRQLQAVPDIRVVRYHARIQRLEHCYSLRPLPYFRAHARQAPKTPYL